MEMIATSKMRRAQERGLAGRPYSEKIRQVISALAALPEADKALHPLLERRPIKKIAVVHITPDRGLCGGLNANINRLLVNFLKGQEVPATLISVGIKGLDFARRFGADVSAEFTWLGDSPTFLGMAPVSRIAVDDFTNGLIDAVYVSYTRFVSTMVQKPVIEQILPVEPAVIPDAENADYIYEPGSQDVLASLLPRFVEMQIYHFILEAIASEQSARMVAMRDATENGNELVSDLTLMYNKARQEAITTELLDITSGVAAVS
jgi:F-type H+-transporting ATPase subunit gamma